MMAVPSRFSCQAALIAGIIAAALAALWPVAAQTVGEDAPLPPGVRGDVSPLRGGAIPLTPVISELRGVTPGLKGGVESLQGALKDLGATVKGKEIKISLSADVLFDFDKADLRPEADPELRKVVTVLQSYPKAAVLIEGHTDGKGNDRYNQALSERRAESVRRWLAEHGVGAGMTTRGWGKRRPVAPNAKPNGSDDPEGRQKNRRVEITVRT